MLHGNNKSILHLFSRNPEIRTFENNQLFGHKAPFLQIVQVRRTMYGGH